MSNSSALNAKFTVWYPATYEAVIPNSIKGAHQAANTTTKSLAASSTMAPLSAQTASTGSNMVLGENVMVSSLHTLQEKANQACIIDKNPTECARASQQLGAQTAIENGPGGSAVRALDALKSRGSIDSYFYYPTWVQTIKPTNPTTAGVALSLAALNRP